MSDGYRQLLDATIQHLEGLKSRDVRHITVAPETLRLWESGRGVDRDALILIADATGAALHWLIAGFTPSQVETFYSATRVTH